MTSTLSASHPAAGKPIPADLFTGVRYFINDDVDAATQEEVSVCFG